MFREDGLISPSPNFGLDWFEGAIPKPDQVLRDFYTAYHPNGPVRMAHVLSVERQERGLSSRESAVERDPE